MSVASEHFVPSSADLKLAGSLRAAIDELPLPKRDEVWTTLFVTMAQFHRTGDIGPLRHFAGSLVFTAELHKNRRYLKALAEDEFSERPSGEPVATDITELFAQARAARQ